jgi:hypothetical protein
MECGWFQNKRYSIVFLIKHIGSLKLKMLQAELDPIYNWLISSNFSAIRGTSEVLIWVTALSYPGKFVIIVFPFFPFLQLNTCLFNWQFVIILDLLA